MNEDKELEEAIKRCKHIIQNFNDMRKYELPPHKFTINSEDSDCIEKILVELENSIPKKKIEDKIEETNKKIEEYVKKKDETNDFMNFYSREILKLNGKLFGYKELLDNK